MNDPRTRKNFINIIMISLFLSSASLLPAPGLAIDWSEESAGLPQDLHPEDVIHWNASSATSHPDGSVSIGVRLTTENNFTIYQDKVEFSSPSGFFPEKVIAPATKLQTDPITGKEAQVYTGGEFSLLFRGMERYQEETFPVSIRFVGCTEVICLKRHITTLAVPHFTSNHPAPAIFTQTDPEKQKPEVAQAAPKEEPAPTGNTASGADDLSLEDQLASQVRDGELGLIWLLLALFLGGILTNLTPCVYPMIPITIRLLSGQSKNPWIGSGFYAAGIVVTYSALGIFAAMTGSMFGQMMASPTFNLVFALIMAILGLSMLGFGNLAFLQNIGNRIGTGEASPKNAFLMGTGAGLVASPCTGPILAALLTYTSSQGTPLQSSLLMLVYSLGFGLPYVFLGGAAARLSGASLPSYIQVAVKIIFASVMFALAFYYLRIPAYTLLKKMDLYWQTLSVAGISAGLVLAVAILASAKLQQHKGFLLVPALILGTGVFSSSQWLAKSSSEQGRKKLTWVKDEGEALKLAKERGVPVLIDMWAEWCEACKKMDATTFSDPQVIELLNSQNWVLLKLDLTESTDANDLIQEKYKVSGLPTLIILPANPDGKTLTLAGYTSPQLLRQKITNLQTSTE